MGGIVDCAESGELPLLLLPVLLAPPLPSDVASLWSPEAWRSKELGLLSRGGGNARCPGVWGLAAKRMEDRGLAAGCQRTTGTTAGTSGARTDNGEDKR